MRPDPQKMPGTSRPTAPPIAANRTRIAVMAVILASIAVVAALSRGAFDTPVAEPPRLRTLTYSGRDSAPAASPDGKLVAFVSTRDGRNRIWLKQLADGTEAVLTAGS